MKRIFKIFILTLSTLALAVSCDYLDKRESTSGLSEEEVFGNAHNYEMYVEWMLQNPGIRYLQNGEVPMGSYDDISDNSMSTPRFPVASLVAASGNYLGMMGHVWMEMCNYSTWERFWKHVRIANMGISHIDMYPGDDAGRNKILGTCYFFRGFTYFELCRRWGGMPYMTEPFTDFSEDLSRSREDMRTTYLKAAEDFQKASEYLEPTVPATEWQHPTSVAALALKSRCLLYAASRQATEEGGIVREPLWKEAIQAADAAIKLAESNGYSLADKNNYYDIFKGKNDAVFTKEILWGRIAAIAWGAHAYTRCIRPPGRLAGQYGVATNQRFVDAYDMENGYPISDPKSGYNPQNPYINRGPRFEHDIMYNQKKVFNNKFTMQLYQRDEATGKLGSPDMVYENGTLKMGFTPTCTYGMKWMGKDFGPGAGLLFQHWPYIRMAELYLNFAECAAELKLPIDQKYNDSAYTPLEALNKIRKRAGIADLPSEYYPIDKFSERVRNERRVELSFEEHRYFDIRRWLIGPTSDLSVYGVYVTKLKPGYDASVYPTGFKYELMDEPVLKKVFEDRHNLFPIHRNDTYLSPVFQQNPGW